MPRPFTPISTIPSCPLSLIQILNGVYYYEVGDCETGHVTGWTTSMAPLTVGCDEVTKKCKSPTPSIALQSSSVLARKKPKPPGMKKLKKEAAKLQATQFNRRSKVGSHRKVKEYDPTSGTGTAGSWFLWAIENDPGNVVDWAAASAELATSTSAVKNPATVDVVFSVSPEGERVSRPVTQSVRTTAAENQQKFLTITEAPLINASIVKGSQPLKKSGKDVILRLPADAADVASENVGSAATRFFRVFEVVLKKDTAVRRLDSTLYLGQEINEDDIPAMGYTIEAATLVDGHEFLAVLEYSHMSATIQVHCSTVEPLVPDSDYV